MCVFKTYGILFDYNTLTTYEILMSKKYQQAGVDIDAAEQLVKLISPLAQSTYKPAVITGVGGFGAVFDPRMTGYVDPLIVSSTDGVGTKLLLAAQTGIWQHIGEDLVAMCVNDLLVQGAEPQFFLDYYATSRLDTTVAQQVIGSIAHACVLAGCSLVGGECAEMPGVYLPKDCDMAGFAVGFVERPQLLPANIQEGDQLLGLASSGFHSNGYSLIRKIVANMDLEQHCPWAPYQTLAQALMTPTRIYVKSVIPLVKANLLKGVAHITGGGLYSNVMRIIPAHLDAQMGVKIPAAFYWMQSKGEITTEELYQVFNCGVGMVLLVSPDNVTQVSDLLIEQGEQVMQLGKVIAR
jgi:phosphoribosylformylglycinamidine cyclo-ligase